MPFASEHVVFCLLPCCVLKTYDLDAVRDQIRVSSEAASAAIGNFTRTPVLLQWVDGDLLLVKHPTFEPTILRKSRLYRGSSYSLTITPKSESRIGESSTSATVHSPPPHKSAFIPTTHSVISGWQTAPASRRSFVRPFFQLQQQNPLTMAEFIFPWLLGLFQQPDKYTVPK